MSDKNTNAYQFAEYIEQLLQSAGNSTLAIANKGYVQHTLAINKGFYEANKLLSDVESVDFADSNGSAQKINQFVAKATLGKIENFLDPSTLDASVKVIIANAIAFRGTWAEEFEEAHTEQGTFHTSDGEEVSADFMKHNEVHDYAALDDLDASALKMRYTRSNFSFVIVLPNQRHGLPALERTLANYDVTKIDHRFKQRFVDVSIPKFRIESQLELKEILKSVRKRFTYRISVVFF